MSPAYDLNPIVGRQGLHLNITDKANGLDYGLAFEVMVFFRLTGADATRIYDEVPGCRAAGLPGWRAAVQQWQSVATRLGISRHEQLAKQAAFNL